MGRRRQLASLLKAIPGEISKIEYQLISAYFHTMALTLDQIVEEARRLPAEQKAELVDRLTSDLHAVSDVESAWRHELRRRVQEIESGQVTGIPGEIVSARIRKIVGR
jgi:putative addiction module component (TIGR02574 family)